MPHIALVGRKAPKTRAVIAAIYLALIVGGITMVVPFWLMLTTSVTSNVDSHDYTLLPDYLRGDEALYKKFTESAYNEDSKLYNYVNAGGDISDFRDVKKPAEFKEQLVTDYDQWKDALPHMYTITLHGYSVAKPKISLMGAHLYQKFLIARYGNDIEALNRAYRDNREYFDLQTPNEGWYQRVYQPVRDKRFAEYVEFKKGLPTWLRAPAPAEGRYVEFLTNKYDQKPETFAKRYGDPTIKQLTDLTTPARLPANPNLAADWVDYVRHEVPVHFVLIAPAAAGEWHAFIKTTAGSVGNYNLVHRDDPGFKPVTDLAQVPLPAEAPTAPAALSDYTGFIENAVSPQYVQLDTPNIRYRDFLRKKFQTVAAMNAAYGTTYPSFDLVQFPTREGGLVVHDAQ